MTHDDDSKDMAKKVNREAEVIEVNCIAQTYVNHRFRYVTRHTFRIPVSPEGFKTVTTGTNQQRSGYPSELTNTGTENAAA
jgi:hypothetical protein